jgi:Spy/CpxP family protein refolding chaperone
MSRDEIKKLKSTIYNKVDQMDDEVFLQMVEEAVTAYSSTSQKDILDELTPEQKQRLQESVKQADEGKTIPDEEIKIKAKEWLSK